MKQYDIRSRILFAAAILTCLLLASACAEPEPEYTTDGKPVVVFSHEAGAQKKRFRLKLSAPKDCVIYYTTDGSLPDQNANLYKRPIKIKGSGNNWLTQEIAQELCLTDYYTLESTPEITDAWIIRAAACAPDGTFGPVVTKTYFPGGSLEEEYGKMLVLSLVTEPDNLTDYEIGLMVLGKQYEDWRKEEPGAFLQEDYWTWPANYQMRGKDWERPISIELFDASETQSLQVDCGLRIHGGMSRAYPHRSLRLCFREKYGMPTLEYDLFSGADTAGSYESLVLRNGGNSAQSLIYKDGWQQELLKDRAFSTQHTRPAIVYLNGEFWGVYALNDRYDETYMEQHFGVQDALVIKEDEVAVGEDADIALYEELNTFAARDLAREEEWQAFCAVMDVQSMADYYAAQTYMGNADLQSDQNMELWRSIGTDPQNPYADGRWRYMLFDTEYSSSLYGLKETSAAFDTISYLAERNPLFEAALRNASFRELFFTALAEIGQNELSAARVDETLGAWDAQWGGLLEKQYGRFGGSIWETGRDLELIRAFYDARNERMEDFATQLRSK